MTNKLISIPSPTSKQIVRDMYGISRYAKRANYLDRAENLIRWGHTKTVEVSGLELNKRDAILLSSNKPECRKVLAEAEIPVPKATETQYPVVGRSRKHKAGDNFFYCKNKEEVQEAKENGAVYFSQYYPKTNEYRVHVGSGKVLLMSIKEGDKTQRVWNKKLSNFNFRHLRRSVWLNDKHLRKMCRTAKKAIKAVGLDFGAVDIMADAGEGHEPFVVTEINTAPSLSPLAIEKYIQYFEKAINDYESSDDEEDEEWEDE